MSDPDQTTSTTARSPRRRWPWLLAGLVIGAGVGTVVAASQLASEDTMAAATGAQVAHNGIDAGHEDRATTEPETADQGGHDHAHGESPGGWYEAADGFGRTFTNIALGQQPWFEAMKAWLTPQQAAKYEGVPITNIPTGSLAKVEVGDPGGALFAVGELTYDTGLVLRIGLTYDSAGRWLVASISAVQPVR